MKCSEAKAILSEISDKAISIPLSQTYLDFLTTSGYVLQTSGAEYDRAVTQVANLDQRNQQVLQKRQAVSAGEATLEEDKKKFLSYLFPLHGADYKDATREKLEADKKSLTTEEVDLSSKEANISDYIQKKSALDQLVPYGGEYLSLTSAGVIMLNSLTDRMSRVSDMEFSDFVQESSATDDELKGLAKRASDYVSSIRIRINLPSDTI